MRRFVPLVAVLVTLLALGAVGVFAVFYKYGRGLPDYQQLADYKPPTVTRIHAADGRLIAEYATEKRVFVPITAMPPHLIKAFLAAEDKNFYSHPGVDFLGVLRAVLVNVANLVEDKRPIGASTITQQVAKNFLLSNEVSMERKIKEAILAFRIERAFSKDRILELYLNEIYFGFGSYGVAAAALNYFNKPLDDLTVAETAYLAALPKAPNNYHPIRRHAAATARRNWVIGRMREEGFITRDQAKEAWARPLEVYPRDDLEIVPAAYFVEEVRREVARHYGDTALYEGGLSVRTTLDPRLQNIADRTLRAGLIAYDRRHGWRGPVGQIPIPKTWTEEAASALTHFAATIPLKLGHQRWQLAAVTAVASDHALLGFEDGTRGRLPLAEMSWARPWYKGQKVGAAPKTAGDVVKRGDVVVVEAVTRDKDGADYSAGTYGLRQIPAIEGAIVALDPHTGRVLAMTGGFSFADSEFNRATQALRQPGSAFKPFVYLAALEQGFTPSTIILDAPFVIDQGAGLGKWKPANYTKTFYGPSPMRLGIEKSRNLMTVRLARLVGMDKVSGVAERFGIVGDLPPVLAMALGAGETTLLRLTAAYGMLANGGHHIVPTVIDRIQDRNGKTLFRHDARVCTYCRGDSIPLAPPEIDDIRPRVTDPVSAYQIVSLLQGVVERGTGRTVSRVGKPLAGKTGTTNDSMDAWFIGFSPDLVAGVFIGFDTPQSLGERETGASVAAPVFRDFMSAALKGKPAVPFRMPPGVRLIRVDAETGLPAGPDAKNVILEAFRPGTEPSLDREVHDGGLAPLDPLQPAAVTGGLY